MSGIVRAAESIISTRGTIDPRRAALVGISGIDGSGKSHLGGAIAAELAGRGVRVATFSVDGWLNLPEVRFSPVDPARRFYEQGIRFEPMFNEVLLPLREKRSLHIEVDHLEETATRFARREYLHHDVDVIMVEGIFLFRRQLRRHFDLTFWIECSFPTALARAVARSQEGLGREDTIRAYQTIYFPAQRLHFERDNPQASADRIILNDGPIA